MSPLPKIDLLIHAFFVLSSRKSILFGYFILIKKHIKKYEKNPGYLNTWNF